MTIIIQFFEYFFDILLHHITSHNKLEKLHPMKHNIIHRIFITYVITACFIITSATSGISTLHDNITWDARGTRYTLAQDHEGAYNWLFIPGGPGADASYFLPFIQQLHLPGKTWLIDFPGNGDNTKDQAATSFDDWSDCLLEVVQKFKNPICVGHSFGGMLALSRD